MKKSQVIIKFLQCVQKYSYIRGFEIIADHRLGKIGVDLIGRHGVGRHPV